MIRNQNVHDWISQNGMIGDPKSASLGFKNLYDWKFKNCMIGNPNCIIGDSTICMIKNPKHYN